MRQLALTLILVAATPVGGLADETTAQPPALPTPTPVNLRQMTFHDVPPKEGYRYGKLSREQTRALRRDFRLPMEALSAADSPTALANAAEVAPLPSPNEPILAAGPAKSVRRNPFTGGAFTSFRDDPMKAFGELLGATDQGDATIADDGDFGVARTELSGAAETAEAEAAPADDPFSADDPFGSDASASEDPFDF